QPLHLASRKKRPSLKIQTSPKVRKRRHPQTHTAVRRKYVVPGGRSDQNGGCIGPNRLRIRRPNVIFVRKRNGRVFCCVSSKFAPTRQQAISDGLNRILRLFFWIFGMGLL